MEQAELFKQFLAFQATVAGGTPGSSGRGRSGKRERDASPSPERSRSPKRVKPAASTMNGAIKSYIERGKEFTMTMTAGEATLTKPITTDDFTNSGALPVRIA